MQYNYKGYGTDKTLTVAATAPINIMSKKEILALQEKLIKLGLDTNGVDGIYGKGTTNAVMILQRRTGLTIDGIAGEATLAKIDQLLRKKSLVGTPGIFRVVTGTFVTPEAAEKAVEEIRVNHGKEQMTIVFIPASSHRLSLQKKHGYLLQLNMGTTQELNRIVKVHNKSPGAGRGYFFDSVISVHSSKLIFFNCLLELDSRYCTINNSDSDPYFSK